MPSARDGFSSKVKKTLEARVSSQCSNPDCGKQTSGPHSEKDKRLNIGVAAHICAASPGGPRYDSSMTTEERSSIDNGIWLCQDCSIMIDNDDPRYSIDVLKNWKKRAEEIAHCEHGKRQHDPLHHKNFPKEIVDKKIEDDLFMLRKSRFFAEFNEISFSEALANKLIERELSGGSDEIKSIALAWCARVLASEKPEEARKYIANAKIWKGNRRIDTVDIAEALLVSREGDKKKALSILGAIDSPSSRSASLMVVARHEGASAMFNWLKATGITPVDLDADGKCFLISQQLECARWNEAWSSLDGLTDEDFQITPVLYHIQAITLLLKTVPEEFRALVLKQISLFFNAKDFPLASDDAGLVLRRRAHGYFVKAAEAAKEIGCSKAAMIDSMYALWLALRDPEMYVSGKKRLEEHLRDIASALRFVPLALQFGIELDSAKVEREIEKQTALYGGATQDVVIARFALACEQSSPQEIANSLARYREELSQHLDKRAMSFLQIQLFAEAGMYEKAKDQFESLLEEGLSHEEESHLRSVLAEAKGADPVQIRMENYRRTDDLRDLTGLVYALEDRKDWEALCEFGSRLFERTRTGVDLERLIRTLATMQKFERIIEILQKHSDFCNRSLSLRHYYCSSLYHEGDFLAAKEEMEKLADGIDDQGFRMLRVKIGIALGDWDLLVRFLTDEYRSRANRSAQELMAAAQLGHDLGAPIWKELRLEAVKKADGDAALLANAYFMSVKDGREDEVEPVQWLHKAVELSSENNGPFQSKSLQEVVALLPEWNSRASEVWEKLRCGEIPMYLAGMLLNKSLVHMLLLPALANRKERDPRKRRIIPAYSGKREPMSLKGVGKSIGIDVTALLTIGFLEEVDTIFNAFETIFVPHSALSWFLMEKQQIAYHQPSRIQKAHKIRELMARDVLKTCSASIEADTDLTSQVGEELATLIVQAKKLGENGGKQHLVVRPFPVYRPASLMKEEADLAKHATVMSGCLAVVEKLRQMGRLTGAEVEKAREYLQLQEKSWPMQPNIENKAVLYLDDIALEHFLHLELLEKLYAADFTLVIPQSVEREVSMLIAYENITEEARGVIEQIQDVLRSGMESGKVKAGRSYRRGTFDDPQDDLGFSHPTEEALILGDYCDAILSDDRYINQYANIGEGEGHAKVFSTLDLLEMLASEKFITPEKELEHRTRLRCAGYCFIPVREDELLSQLRVSSINESELIETAELKAIQENLLCIRMGGWLQLPQEAAWLYEALKVFTLVLKSLWTADADLEKVRFSSDWILEQTDIRGWAYSLGSEAGDDLVNTGWGAHIMGLLSPPPLDVPQQMQEEYWKWVEERVLVPIQDFFPELYDWIVEWQRLEIPRLVEVGLKRRKQDGTL